MLTRGENEGPARYSTGQNRRGLSGVKDTALCSQQGLPDGVEGFVRGRKKRERHLVDRLLWEGKGLDLEETCLWVIRNKDFSHSLCPRTCSDLAVVFLPRCCPSCMPSTPFSSRATVFSMN